MPHGTDVTVAARREGVPHPERFDGWNSQLKPGHEPIVLARKPLDGTLAANMDRYGTGALHVDACRVPFRDDEDKARAQPRNTNTTRHNRILGTMGVRQPYTAEARFPPDILMDDTTAATIGDEARYFSSSQRDAPSYYSLTVKPCCCP